MEHMRDNYIKRYGPTDVRLAPVYLDLGRALSLQDSSKAKKALNNAINLYENKNQTNDPDYVRALIQLGYAEAWNFRPLAAKSDYQRALEISSEIFGDSAEITGEAHVALGQCYLTLGHYKSAEQEYKRAIAIFDARLSPTDVRTLAARGALVPLYKKQGRTDEAMEQTMELAMLAPDAEGQEQPLYQIAPENLYNGTNGFYQGAVEVKFTVTTEGRVEDIQFVGKRSNTVTEDTIRKAMSQWIYKPRVVNGKPVESHRSIRFNFSHFN